MKWISLQPGDLVDVIAPGMKPRPDVIKGIRSFLQSWGLEARFPKDLVSSDLICSSDRSTRQKHLESALLASDSKMIWCLRGGYGSIHLLPSLQKLKPQRAKIFLGLSDITSLHLFLNQQWGWSTIHGCNLDRFALGEGSRQEEQRLKKMLFHPEAPIQFKIKPLNDVALQKSDLKGLIVGGNLITLQSSFATPFELQTQGKILFVEDIGERAYRIDRVFEQMSQMGLFKNLKGLIFGQFTGGNEPDGKNLIGKWMSRFAQEQKFPVYKGLPSGHGANQHPLPLNTKAHITLADRKVNLVVESGGVHGA